MYMTTKQPMTLCSHLTKIQSQTLYLRWGWFLRWILYLFVNQMPLLKKCEIHQYWNAWRFVHDHKVTWKLWWSYLTKCIIAYHFPHHIAIFFFLMIPMQEHQTSFLHDFLVLLNIKWIPKHKICSMWELPILGNVWGGNLIISKTTPSNLIFIFFKAP
jgi:hypothetical protein